MEPTTTFIASFVLLTLATSGMALIHEVKANKKKDKSLVKNNMIKMVDKNGNEHYEIINKDGTKQGVEDYNKFLYKQSKKEAKKSQDENDKLKKELAKTKLDLDHSKDEISELKVQLKSEIISVSKSKAVSLNTDSEDHGYKVSKSAPVSPVYKSRKDHSPVVKHKHTKNEKLKLKFSEFKTKTKLDLHNDGDNSEFSTFGIAKSTLSDFGDIAHAGEGSFMDVTMAA